MALTSWQAGALCLLSPVAGRLPWLAYAVADFVAFAAWHLAAMARRRVTSNVLAACGDDASAVQRAARSVFRHVAYYYVEMLTLPSVAPDVARGRAVVVSGRAHLAALDGDRPLIIVSAHLGNPERAIQGLLSHGRSFAALVEPLEPRDYAARLLWLRTATGGHYFETTPRGVARAVRAMREGLVLAMLGDRDIQGNGRCVAFQGRVARLPSGPWEIARKEGALVLPMFARRLPGGRSHVKVEAPIDVAHTGDAVEDVTAALGQWARLLETHIRRAPGQWTVLEDFWVEHACNTTDEEHPHA